MNRQARQTAEGLAEKGEKLGRSATFQSISDTARAVKQEIDDSTIGSPGVSGPSAAAARAQLKRPTQPEPTGRL